MPIIQNRGFIRNNAYQNQYATGFNYETDHNVFSTCIPHVINDNEVFVSTGSMKLFYRVLNEHDSSSTGKLTLTDIIASQ